MNECRLIFVLLCYLIIVWGEALDWVGALEGGEFAPLALLTDSCWPEMKITPDNGVLTVP